MIALVYLATIGAIGGFVAYTYALRHLPVSFVSLYAYINPVIAVALGVLVLHEPFTWRMAIAAGLVFVGVALVRLAQRPKAAEARSSKPAVNGTLEPGTVEAANPKRRSVA
jgi:drug/metabolite transporter (DMT)-like permease